MNNFKRSIVLQSAILFMGILISGCRQADSPVGKVLAASTVVSDQSPDTKANGTNGFIAPGDYTTEHGRIRRNQFLSSLLTDYGVDYPVIDSLIRASDGVFDIRKIRAGNQYTAFLSGDSLARLVYLVYEQTPAEQVVFDLHSPVQVFTVSKPIREETRLAEGTIESSLWMAMLDNNINPALAVELSEIYAWTIDFFGLQQGDHFQVIYQESFVDTLSLGITRILGAYFKHMGEEFYAIPLEQDSTLGFYDQYGNSLRKAFLKAPLRYSRISSRFSYSRMHPILKYRRPHLGVDYAAPIGTPVEAIGDGRIISAGYQSGAGRIVKIRHNSVYTTAYMHLRNFASGIRAGVYVRQGQVIGYVGSSGLSTGPHLDFRFYKNGSPVDPLKVEAPPVEPVQPENMALFEKKRRILVDLFDHAAPD